MGDETKPPEAAPSQEERLAALEAEIVAIKDRLHEVHKIAHSLAGFPHPAK